MTDGPEREPLPRSRIYEIELDPKSIARLSSNVDHERKVAIFDLIEANSFELVGRDEGPYRINLSIAEDRLVFAIGSESEPVLITHMLSMTPFKRIIKDYFMVCDSYYEAIRSAPPSRIQAIDMGRRGLHDEGSTILAERLAGKVVMDFDTSRRLFTLICALHWKG